MGYADLLFSITDNDQLFRDGGMRPTDAFVDSMTQVHRGCCASYSVVSVMDLVDSAHSAAHSIAD